MAGTTRTKGLTFADVAEASLLMAAGGAVKAMTDDWDVSGWLVKFSDADSPDLEKQYFTKSTEFGDHYETDIYFHHGLDPKIGKQIVGKGTWQVKDEGVWLEGWLDKSNKYAGWVKRLRERLTTQGKSLFWSSGTAGHLAEFSDVEDKGKVKAQHIDRWILGLDASLTPTPVEPNGTEEVSAYAAKGLLTLDSILDEGDTLKGISPKYTLGDALAAKVNGEHSTVMNHLLDRQAIGLNDYADVQGQFIGALKGYRKDMGPLGDREVTPWDADTVQYKAGEMMQSVGDCLHAATTRAHNAGADACLSLGIIGRDEHVKLKKAFEKNIGSYVGSLGDVGEKKLGDLGLGYLPMKAVFGDIADLGAGTVSDQVDALLGGAETLVGNVETFRHRASEIKALNGDKLGPKLKNHVNSVLESLGSATASLKSLLPQDSLKAEACKLLAEVDEALKQL